MERPVEVVVSDLHLAAGRLSAAGQRLQDGLSGVDLETRELLGSGWKGGAASAFSGAWDQWHNGAGQVIRGVQTMSELLRVAADQYARADEQGAEAIASASPEQSIGSAPTAGGAGATPSAPEAATPTSSTAAVPPAGSASGAAASGASDAVSQVGQLGGQVSSGLAQAAQTAAGVAQQVGQAVEQIVEQAVQHAAEADKHGEAAPPPDEQPPTGEVPR